MKPGWSAKPLRNYILDIKDGGTPSRQRSEYFGGDVAWCVVKDIKPIIRGTAETLTDLGLSKCSAKLWPKGSVIISLGATIGEIGIAGVPVATKQGLAGIIPDPTKITSEFLAFALREKVDVIRGMARGATIKEVRPNRLAEELVISVPPLEEQKRIVAVLDQAFAALDRARAHTEANLADAEALFQQTVDNLLADRADWRKRPLRELGKTQTGGTPRSSEKGHYGQHIPFIKPGDFARDGSLNYENEGLSEEGALSARRVPAGSALMVCIGATIGKAGYCTQDVTTNQQINALTPHAGTDGRFIYYNFIKSSFQNEVIAKSGQATLPIINKSKWSELVIGVPADLSVQAGVADKLQAMRLLVDQALASYAQKLKALAHLRQSLLQKAFAGELT